MKKVLLTLTLVGFAASVLAQGTVNFVNNGTGVKAPVYGPEVGNNTLSKTGNTTAGTAAGTQVYTGAPLLGPGYRAQLFSGNGTVADANLLVANTPIGTFRTGSAAGYFNLQVVTLANVPADSPLATFQLRVWDNSSGLYADWAAAEQAWRNGNIAAGASTLFQVAAIGGGSTGVNTPPYLAGLTSFNIYYVPEPTTFALAGLGAAALMIFRRRQ